jgi:cyclopropane-fatty-acyl-phospholipid synthase
MASAVRPQHDRQRFETLALALQLLDNDGSGEPDVLLYQRAGTAPTASGTSPVDRYLAERLQRAAAPVGVRIVLWDGTAWYGATGQPVGDLIIRDRGTLFGLAINPELQFGESYAARRLEVGGPLEPVVEALSRIATPSPSWVDRLRAAMALPTSIAAGRRNVHDHYDLGNDFYAQWLDRDLLYSCAYFPTRDATLEAAQHAKLDLVCRKLQLRRDEYVVEAGCGWGALALFMAREYGVRVRAFNVSREQLEYARDRARREDLTSRVEFVDDDYRHVTGQCDAFVSVGMLEHVGRHQFAALADVLQRTIRPGHGRGLLHFIGRDATRPVNAWIRRHVFPGSYTPTLAEVSAHVLTPAGMSVVDVENLRLHYALTLRHWSERFAAARAAVSVQYGDAFARTWELYLAGSEAAFATGWMQLFQIVFAPRTSAPPYWARESVYPPSTARPSPC